MDIFDRVASDFVKEARIPSTKNINRSTGKPWTKKEVETAYKKWVNKVEKKDKKSYKLWKKFEGASTSKGKLNETKIVQNVMRLNERGYRGKEIFVSYGKPDSKGGEGVPDKKEQRKQNKVKRQQSKNFGKKKPSRRKDLTQHNKKASYREASQRVANRYLAVRGLV